jgi:hypothetical protein
MPDHGGIFFNAVVTPQRFICFVPLLTVDLPLSHRCQPGSGVCLLHNLALC